jgi:hypothetical protein
MGGENIQIRGIAVILVKTETGGNGGLAGQFFSCAGVDAVFYNRFLYCVCGRIIEDYAVVYFGSALFKIGRLLLIATFSVHIFACVFFRVKIVYAAAPEDVANFYTSRNIDPEVCSGLFHVKADGSYLPFVDTNIDAAEMICMMEH